MQKFDVVEKGKQVHEVLVRRGPERVRGRVLPAIAGRASQDLVKW